MRTVIYCKITTMSYRILPHKHWHNTVRRCIYKCPEDKYTSEDLHKNYFVSHRLITSICQTFRIGVQLNCTNCVGITLLFLGRYQGSNSMLVWRCDSPIYRTPQSKVSTRLRRIPLASCLLMHRYSILAMNASARDSLVAISVHASMSDGPDWPCSTSTGRLRSWAPSLSFGSPRVCVSTILSRAMMSCIKRAAPNAVKLCLKRTSFHRRPWMLSNVARQILRQGA